MTKRERDNLKRRLEREIKKRLRTKLASAGGRARAANLTTERKREIANLGVAARARKANGSL